MSEFERPVCLPVLALRGLCVFPKMLTHFDVGRKSSMAAVEEALREDQQIFLVTQKDVETDHPKRNDLYTVGTVSIVKQVLRLPGENMRPVPRGASGHRAERALSLRADAEARGAALQPQSPARGGAAPSGAQPV